MHKFENETITVTVVYDDEKVIDSMAIRGNIVYFRDPIKGAWCVEARPKENGTFIEGIGLYSICYELTKDAAVSRALEYLAKTE